MAEVFPVEKWNYEENGPISNEWIRPQILFKTKDPKKFEEYRMKILYSIREIIKELEELRILKSFYFLYQGFPQNRFECNESTYYDTIIDLSIRVGNTEDKTQVSNKIESKKERIEKIIKKEFGIGDRNEIIDYGFWHFPERHPPYCTDPVLHDDMICKIYEYFCRFLFEKLDTKSTKNIIYENLGQGNSNNIQSIEIDYDDFQKIYSNDSHIKLSDFSNWKIIHCFLNSQGMNIEDEIQFAFIHLVERLIIGRKIHESYPIQIEIIDGKGNKTGCKLNIPM